MLENFNTICNIGYTISDASYQGAFALIIHGANFLWLS